MPRSKKYAALENDLKEVFNAEIEYRATQKENGGKNKTAEEAQKESLDEVLAMKKDGLLSYNNLVEGSTMEEKFISPIAKQLWPGVVQKCREANKEAKKQTQIDNWWYYRMLPALPQKSKGGGKRKIGDLMGHTERTAEGKAIKTALNSEGMLQVFDEKELSTLMEAIHAITTGNEGFRNKCCAFTDEEKEEIALAKIIGQINLVAQIQDANQGNKVVILGMEVKEFIKRFGSEQGLKSLEEMARKHAENKAAVNHVTDKNTIHAAGSLMLVTLAQIITNYLNIKKALDHPKCCALKDKDGDWRILVCGEEEMEREICVGMTIQRGHEYDECERKLKGCEFTFTELWATSGQLVIDTNAKTDPTSTNDPLYKKIKLHGTNRFLRIVVIGLKSAESMITFECNVGGTSMNLHRLIAVYENHYGWGFSQSPLIKEFLDLKDGQSFEDHERFKYRQGLSNSAIRAELRKETRLVKKDWDESKLSKMSDIDHLVGRSEIWMNSNLFCMSVSHSWNQAMSYVRICYGDWLFGFTNIKYQSGREEKKYFLEKKKNAKKVGVVKSKETVEKGLDCKPAAKNISEDDLEDRKKKKATGGKENSTKANLTVDKKKPSSRTSDARSEKKKRTIRMEILGGGSEDEAELELENDEVPRCYVQPSLNHMCNNAKQDTEDEWSNDEDADEDEY